MSSSSSSKTTTKPNGATTTTATVTTTTTTKKTLRMEEVHMTAASTDQLLLGHSHNDIDAFDLPSAAHRHDHAEIAPPSITLYDHHHPPTGNSNKKRFGRSVSSAVTNGYSTNDYPQYDDGDEDGDRYSTAHSSMLDAQSEQQPSNQLTGKYLTLMNIIKANVGTGILAMPLAFKHSGLALGVICIVAFCIICVECMQIVLRAAHYFQQHHAAGARLSYPSVARLAFHYSPLRRWARFARQTVIVFLYITQLGFCCVYIVFVARTIDNVARDFGFKPFNIRVIEMMLMPFFMALVMVRSMNLLAKLMTVANVITFAALIIAYQEQARHLLPITSLPQFGSALDFPRFFGTAIYAFEGIGCVLPIENKMRQPGTFGGLFGILNRAMLIVAVLYATTGFLGYVAYGDAVQGSITYNLPNTPLYVTVKLGMALAVFFSYALQLYVPIKMLTPFIKRHEKSSYHHNVCDYAVRMGLLLLTLALALFIPHLAEFIGLIGAFGGGYLALVLPPVIDMVYRYHTKSPRYGRFGWILIKDVAILLFGVAGFVLGTYLAVYDIVEKFRMEAEGGGAAPVVQVSSSSAMVNTTIAAAGGVGGIYKHY